MFAWLRRRRRETIRRRPFPIEWRAFFEKSRRLREKHPLLYSQLQQFYRQDPAALGKG
jgi:Mlc titration factor MtfA (ptsG expression regulator)